DFHVTGVQTCALPIYPGGAGHRGRLDQHLRRVRGDRADAQDVPEELSAVAAANVLQASYVVAGVLFVMSLAGLSRHETARRGNRSEERRVGEGRRWTR